MRKRKEETLKMIPDILKSIREGVSISQIEMAKFIGISRQSLCQWESGQTIPTGEQLGRWITTIRKELRYLRIYDDLLRRLTETFPERQKQIEQIKEHIKTMI